MKYLYLFLTLFFSSFISFSQDYSVKFLDISDGLSNNSITTIYQDKDGYMWFGTYDGLNRYDGYSFKVFRNEINNENSLSNNTVYSLEGDSKRQIWIGGNKGASVYDKSKALFHTVQYKEKENSAAVVLKNVVHQIKAVSNELVLLATQNSGLVVFEDGSFTGKTVPITKLKKAFSYDAVAIQKDKKGSSCWVYVRNLGICNYNYSSKKMKLIAPLLMELKCMESDSDGNLWMGTDEGLFIFNTSTFSISKNYFSTKCIVSNILRDKKNQFWVGTDGWGIYKLDRINKKVIPYSKGNGQQIIKSSSVWSVYEDYFGNIWFGTLRGGISMISSTPKYFKNIKYNIKDNNLAQNFILSGCEDEKQNLWIGTDGAGLRYWNRKQDTYTVYDNNPNSANYITSNFITNVIRDSNNEIWLSTWAGGVNRINPKTNLISHYSCYNPFAKQVEKNIWLVFEDAQKNLWASATNEGCLYIFDRSKNSFRLYDRAINNLQCLTQTSDGKLWGGNYTSIVWIDKANRKQGKINIGYPVRCIHEDKNKQLWVATQEGGLLLFNRKTNTFKRFTTADGLSSNTILRILEDKKGNLWMSTYNGLSRLNIKTKTFRIFSKNDGLQSNQFSFNAGLKLSTGEFLFGGINGFNLFYPESVKEGASNTKILLSDLSVNNEPIETKPELISEWNEENQIKEIRLPYDQTTLSIEFVALDYSGADKINYAYFLEGWDDQWSNVGQNRKVNYPHLSEGTYLFKVKTSNFQDESGKAENLIRIVVLPPWYRSWWAYLLYLVIGGAIIYNYVRYSKYKERLKYKVKIAELEREKEKEIAEKQSSMFTYISHEFRTPLSLIINPLKKVIKKEDVQNDASKGDLQIAYRNARRLLSLVDQLLLFRKAENDADVLRLSEINMNDLCQEVYQCFVNQAKDRKIDYTIKIPQQTVSIIGDYEKIEISLFNLVSNAFKYTAIGGSISVELIEAEKEVSVVISDTGTGIAQQNIEAIFEKFKQLDSKVSVSTGFGIGLYIVKYFVDKHKGAVSCESEIGKGSRFTLTFLKGQQHFDDLPISPNVPKMTELVEELLADDMNEDATVKVDMIDQELNKELLTEKKSVLIIDDNTEIRNYLIQLFSKSHLVYSAVNGDEGLKLTKKHLPDIVISDIAMEVMDGLELCKKIKESDELSHIPVVLLTATNNPETHLQGITDGADDYITKPFDDDLLVARVNTLLKNRGNLRKYFLDSITLRENDQKVPAEYQDFLKRCIDIIEANIGNRDFTIKNFAAEMGMSHRTLYTKIKIISGETLNAFIRSIRLRRAAMLLLTENMNINQASVEVGFEDQKYFRQQFVKLFGMTPSMYVKKYKDSFNKDLNIIK
ncbi:hybrid sensor histidine kinase/response regulator [Flavobacterium sufflavum]|uniref:histidine kinase n=1 Tax=Flavobacterium sufflavum TaxID=1921138 RepID=A0A3S2V4U1_9FLAO|nr:hybrid sensor histidine kinase/response regulator transcription factor [Flavobacterium sufflavum]RVT76661.1 hybrid sensor histidine kinase/response regulator [Flavobacterium sufflavum]